MNENLSRVHENARSFVRRADITDLLRKMITGEQIRMARAAVNLTVAELSERCGVSTSTLQRAENTVGVPRMQSTNLFRVQRALESAGVIFVDGDDRVGEGVRLRRVLPSL